MNKLSVIIKGSISLLGLVSVGNFMAAPASAEQAAARGAVTIVRPSGSSISVSGEVTLPSGAYYDGALTVAPTAGAAGTNQETVTSLLITPGTVTGVATVMGSGNPFLDAAAKALGDATAIEDQAAIIRAGAGVDGLGGLE
ncbi:hypothetical protein GS682_15465 [Nostoc sp. B(2019)]|nr:hypothetical protein [Nostoc sp. B(2019)]